jgi:hypothetical protein
LAVTGSIAGDPLLGGYYLRWWLVEQIHGVCGHGALTSNFPAPVHYHRLISANIANGIPLYQQAVIAK